MSEKYELSEAEVAAAMRDFVAAWPWFRQHFEGTLYYDEIPPEPFEAALRAAAAVRAETHAPRIIDIVFDGPPSHESGRFVEVEDGTGKSIKVGEWIKRPDGYWTLRIDRTAPTEPDNNKPVDSNILATNIHTLISRELRLIPKPLAKDETEEDRVWMVKPGNTRSIANLIADYVLVASANITTPTEPDSKPQQKTIADAQAAIDNLINPQPAPFVPEGWQLVPKKFPEEMVVAWYNARQLDFQGRWNTLLAAAPPPPSHPELSDVVRDASLRADLDRYRIAERELSKAYVRLRGMIPGALDTPHAPTSEQIWDITEKALARALAPSRPTEGDGWLKIDENTPRVKWKHLDLWVVSADGGRREADAYWLIGWTNNRGFSIEDHVTHWRPLPAPPSAEGKE